MTDPTTTATHLIVGDIHGCFDELDALIRLVADPRRSLIAVGDLVGKGPAPGTVIQYLRSSGSGAVLGNHDDRAIQRQSSNSNHRHAGETESKLHPDDLAFLAALPLWIRLPVHRVLVVHAGLLPEVPIDRQMRKHLLTLRSFRDDGTPSDKVEGTPWAARWNGPEHVIFGHDAVRGLQQLPFATGLDTGCVYGKRLTGLLLPERELVSVPAKRTYRHVSQ